MGGTIRGINAKTKESAVQLFYNNRIVYFHPGWFEVNDITDESIFGSIYCADEPRDALIFREVGPGTCWILGCTFKSKPDPDVFALLLNDLFNRSSHPINKLYAIPQNKWFSDLLINFRFRECDRIIGLIRYNAKHPTNSEEPHHSLEIGNVSRNDIPEIIDKCESAFPLIWRLPRAEFEKAFKMSYYSLKISGKDGIEGYLLAQREQNNSHLMRIAVAPEHQGHGLSGILLERYHQDAAAAGATSFTVNTNAANRTAIKLYQKFGYITEPESVPVFCKCFF